MARLVIMPAVLLAGACALIRGASFQRPTVDLRAVEITGLGITGGTVNLILDVYNPNDYELRTTRIEAALDLEDTHFGDTVLDDRVVLQPGSTGVVEIPVRFTWEGVGAGARGLLERGSVSYRFEGRLRLNTPVGERSLGLDKRGTVPLRDLVR